MDKGGTSLPNGFLSRPPAPQRRCRATTYRSSTSRHSPARLSERPAIKPPSPSLVASRQHPLTMPFVQNPALEGKEYDRRIIALSSFAINARQVGKECVDHNRTVKRPYPLQHVSAQRPKLYYIAVLLWFCFPPWRVARSRYMLSGTAVTTKRF